MSVRTTVGSLLKFRTGMVRSRFTERDRGGGRHMRMLLLQDVVTYVMVIAVLFMASLSVVEGKYDLCNPDQPLPELNPCEDPASCMVLEKVNAYHCYTNDVWVGNTWDVDLLASKDKVSLSIRMGHPQVLTDLSEGKETYTAQMEMKVLFTTIFKEGGTNFIPLGNVAATLPTITLTNDTLSSPVTVDVTDQFHCSTFASGCGGVSVNTTSATDTELMRSVTLHLGPVSSTHRLLNNTEVYVQVLSMPHQSEVAKVTSALAHPPKAPTPVLLMEASEKVTAVVHVLPNIGQAAEVSVTSADTSEGILHTEDHAAKKFTRVDSLELSTVGTIGFRVGGVRDSVVDGDSVFSLDVTAAVAPASGNQSSKTNVHMSLWVTTADANVASLLINTPEVPARVSESGSVTMVNITATSMPYGDVLLRCNTTDATEGVVLGDGLYTIRTFETWPPVTLVPVQGVRDEDLTDGDMPFMVELSPSSRSDAVYGSMGPFMIPFVNVNTYFAHIRCIYPSSIPPATRFGVLPQLYMSVSAMFVTAQVYVNGTLAEASPITNATEIPQGFQQHCRGYSRVIAVQMPPFFAGLQYNLLNITVVNVSPASPEGPATTYFHQVFVATDCWEEGVFRDKQGACRYCPPGGYCPGGDRLRPRNGYWNQGEQTLDVVRCRYPMYERCSGCDLAPSCVENACGRGYAGTLCELCEDGYIETLSRKCVKCEDVQLGAAWLIAGSTVFIISSFMMYFTFNVINIFSYICWLFQVISAPAVMVTRLDELVDSIQYVYAVGDLFLFIPRFQHLECVIPVAKGTRILEYDLMWIVVALMSPYAMMILRYLYTRLISNAPEDFPVEELRERSIHVTAHMLFLSVFPFARIGFGGMLCSTTSWDGQPRLASSLDVVCFTDDATAMFTLAFVFLFLFVCGIVHTTRASHKIAKVYESLQSAGESDYNTYEETVASLPVRLRMPAVLSQRLYAGAAWMVPVQLCSQVLFAMCAALADGNYFTEAAVLSLTISSLFLVLMVYWLPYTKPMENALVITTFATTMFMAILNIVNAVEAVDDPGVSVQGTSQTATVPDEGLQYFVLSVVLLQLLLLICYGIWTIGLVITPSVAIPEKRTVSPWKVLYAKLRGRDLSAMYPMTSLSSGRQNAAGASELEALKSTDASADVRGGHVEMKTLGGSMAPASIGGNGAGHEDTNGGGSKHTSVHRHIRGGHSSGSDSDLTSDRTHTHSYSTTATTATASRAGTRRRGTGSYGRRTHTGDDITDTRSGGVTDSDTDSSGEGQGYSVVSPLKKPTPGKTPLKHKNVERVSGGGALASPGGSNRSPQLSSPLQGSPRQGYPMQAQVSMSDLELDPNINLASVDDEEESGPHGQEMMRQFEEQILSPRSGMPVNKDDDVIITPR
eukprot:GFYU01006130.1.p1 GENE.GFYU01006130.1~~GFYU01006130.1.p1  ORF type:complete len:1393 (-),score=259.65 GFYU01006130.1:279-4457(-)